MSQRCRIEINCIERENEEECRTLGYGSKTVFGPEKRIALTLLGTVCAILFVRTLQAECCISDLLGLLFFAKVLQGAARRYSGCGPGGKPVAQDVDIAVEMKYK